MIFQQGFSRFFLCHFRKVEWLYSETALITKMWFHEFFQASFSRFTLFLFPIVALLLKKLLNCRKKKYDQSISRIFLYHFRKVESLYSEMALITKMTTTRVSTMIRSRTQTLASEDQCHPAPWPSWGPTCPPANPPWGRSPETKRWVIICIFIPELCLEKVSSKSNAISKSRIVSYPPMAILHMTNLYEAHYHGLWR